VSMFHSPSWHKFPFIGVMSSINVFSFKDVKSYVLFHQLVDESMNIEWRRKVRRTLSSLHEVNDSRRESNRGSTRPESEKWFLAYLVISGVGIHVDSPVSDVHYVPVIEYRVAATRITAVSLSLSFSLGKRSGTLFIYYSRR